MSRITRTIRIAAVAAFTAASASSLDAQAALGTPFIGNNTLSFQTAELTRVGGAEMTELYGVAYSHRLGNAAASNRLSYTLRAAARPFDGNQDAGVLDIGATLAWAGTVPQAPRLSVAVSGGIGSMIWGQGEPGLGRLALNLPMNAGVSYDIPVGGATFAPFAMGTLARYDVRTYVDDVRTSSHKGWDAGYTVGTSVRLKEVVLTSSRIVGEYGMPNRSRWMFSAGISF